MNDAQLWSWIVTIVGVIGFYCAGKKLWWSWFIGLFCQILWTVYATVSSQPAFYISVALYTVVYGKNAWAWTKEHFEKKARRDDLEKPLGYGVDLNRLFPEASPLVKRFGTWDLPSNHSGTSFPPDVRPSFYKPELVDAQEIAANIKQYGTANPRLGDLGNPITVILPEGKYPEPGETVPVELTPPFFTHEERQTFEGYIPTEEELQEDVDRRWSSLRRSLRRADRIRQFDAKVRTMVREDYGFER